MEGMEKLTGAQLWAQLTAIARDDEEEMLAELAARAGYLWICECGGRNAESRSECAGCGKERPDE